MRLDMVRFDMVRLHAIEYDERSIEHITERNFGFFSRSHLLFYLPEEHFMFQIPVPP